MKSIMEHSFAQVPKAEIQRSKFDRSHGYKTTFDAGYLVPIWYDEALPGDTHTVNLTAFARLATPIVPIMDNLKMDFFFFSVPLRLIWDNFQKFMGEQTNPGDSTDFLVPTIDVTGATEQSLHDYLGLPINMTNPVVVSTLWHRSYNLIYNEWFRDQNLQDSVVVDKDDGPDTLADYVLLRRGKRHDYFTSALPWPQKGTAVSMPLGSVAPVFGLGKVNQTWSGINGPAFETGKTASRQYASYMDIDGSVTNNLFRVEEDSNNTGFPNIFTDLSSATAATINSLRQAFQIQRLLERDARGGTRYTEVIKAQFGVTSPDARLNRPEYLGGGSVPITINPVTQTSETLVGTPQGNLAAFGTAHSSGVGFTTSFTEHCVLIGLVSVRADLTYQKGIERQYSRSTRFDYYWPALSHIGEQSTLNKEIFFDDVTIANNDLVFGYQERYAEYRYKPSKITGLFRSDATGSIDIWHLSQDFTTLPVLDDTFIQDNPPIDRVIATPAEPHIIYDSYVRQVSARPMPVFGVPGLIDHF